MEDSSNINYQALYEGLQKELEQARLTILKMRYQRSFLDAFRWGDIRSFVEKNYAVLIMGVIFASFIFSSLKTIRALFKPQGETH